MWAAKRCLAVAGSGSLDTELDEPAAKSAPDIVALETWFVDIVAIVQLLVLPPVSRPMLGVRPSGSEAWEGLVSLRSCDPSALEVVLAPALLASSCLLPGSLGFAGAAGHPLPFD